MNSPGADRSIVRRPAVYDMVRFTSDSLNDPLCAIYAAVFFD
jgi:hypothetical protein